MVKTCCYCRKHLAFVEFNNDRRVADGKARYCRACWKALKHKYKDISNKRRRKNYADDPSIKTIIVAKNKNWRYRLRMQLLSVYGGKCNCCGEDHAEFLTLDHVYGGGNEHRKSQDMRTTWLQAINDRDSGRWQLLCMNCNWAKGKYGNCPHQQQLRIVG